MGGDGLNGLAMAIAIAAGLMICVPFLIGVLIGRRVHGSSLKRWSIAAGIGALGAGIGVLAVIATFFESTWEPPLRVKLNTPPGFAHDWIFLLEDPSVSNELRWTGVRIPFFTRTTEIKVPPSGVVRVRELGELGRAPVDEVTSAGVAPLNYGGGPAPEGVSAKTYVVLGRSRATNPASAVEEPPFGDNTALARYILKRERGAN